MEIRNNNLTFGSKVMISPHSFERMTEKGGRKISAALRKLENNNINDFVTLENIGTSWDSCMKMMVTEKRGKDLYIGHSSMSTLCPSCTVANLYKEARKEMRLAEVPKSLIKYSV